MNGKALARALRILADVVKGKNEEELDIFLRSLSATVHTAPSAKGRAISGEANEKVRHQFDFDSILMRLNETASRESANAIIDELHFTKTELLNFARHCDIYISKQDNIERIIEKIIESTVGSRLKSTAIRGE